MSANEHPLTAAVAALFGLAGGGILIALDPIPSVDFLLQWFGLGGAAGLIAAYRARRRDFRLDAWLIMARWSIAGLVFGVLLLAFSGVLSWT